MKFSFRPTMKHLNNSRAQALVEAALIAPLIVVFLFSVIWFARIALTWQQITGAAKYGTDLLAYTPLSASSIKRKITSYLCSEKNVGRILDSKKLSVSVDPQDAKAMDFKLSIENITDGKLLNVLENIDDISIAPKKSSVKIEYSYKMPPVLKLASGKSELKIKARSEVLTGFASSNSTERKK